MDLKVIGLGVLAIILIYILYLYYNTRTTALAKTTSLIGANTPISIKDNPMSYRYTYNVWVYVNTWGWTSAMGGYMPIIWRDYGRGKAGGATRQAQFATQAVSGQTDSPLGGALDSAFAIYFDINSPNLYCQIPETPSSTAPGAVADTAQPYLITSNFPIQSWTYITVSVDSQYVDFYINGKLVKSIQMQGIPAGPSAASSALNLGQGGDIIISGLTRTSTSTGPQDVWNAYINGSPTSVLSSSYNLNVDLVKDQTVQKTYSLF
jgi:hypothetical protein